MEMNNQGIYEVFYNGKFMGGDFPDLRTAEIFCNSLTENGISESLISIRKMVI